MEEKIKLYYAINFVSVVLEKNFYILNDEFYKYYLVPCGRSESELKALYETTTQLFNKNIFCHSFVMNRNSKIMTTIDEQNYCLMRINYPEEAEFNLSEMLVMNNGLTAIAEKGEITRNDWAKLWSEKVDYFEYQMSELGSNKKIIINSLSYYIGLAENAIAYVNNAESKLKEKEQRIVLSRKRVYAPNYAINYLNPLNFIFDLEVRDIAEYIKAVFFSDGDIWPEIDLMFKQRRFNSYEAHMLFARLLFPAYYFDIYERVMESELDEEELLYIIKKVDDYELFLIEMFHYLNNFILMTPIDWLIKKGLKSPQE